MSRLDPAPASPAGAWHGVEKPLRGLVLPPSPFWGSLQYPQSWGCLMGFWGGGVSRGAGPSDAALTAALDTPARTSSLGPRRRRSCSARARARQRRSSRCCGSSSPWRCAGWPGPSRRAGTGLGWGVMGGRGGVQGGHWGGESGVPGLARVLGRAAGRCIRGVREHTHLRTRVCAHWAVARSRRDPRAARPPGSAPTH